MPSIRTLLRRAAATIALLVAVPTTTDAERIHRDLVAYLGEAAVELFPAWETLPFERVSPAVETMGRRLQTLWRLRSEQYVPSVVVAPVRALVQRLGPHVEDVKPIIVRPGDELDPTDLVAQLVGAGYRREYQVEHRGEVALRGSIVDVFPSTADRPVRLDLWGDEVDRLTEFSISDQRSTDDVPAAAIFPCRELLPTPEARDDVLARLAAQGIDARFHYVPLHASPAGIRYGRAPAPLPRTEQLSARLLRLPLWIGVEPELVVRAVREALRGSGGEA